MKKKVASFTLLEILVVATIIGLLASTGLVTYVSLSKSSRDARRKSDIAEIRTALEIYRSDNGYYPSTSFLSSDCTPLTFVSGSTVYMQKTPVDPLCASLRYYRYNPLPSGCNNTGINCTSYTVGALLESSSVNSGCGNCMSSTPCNYCLNEFGEL